MGFAENFSSAFEKGAATAGAGAIDLMKERIKEDRTKAESAAKVAANIEAATSGAEALAKQTGDQTVMNNVRALFYSQDENGKLKAIPQTEESSKAALSLVTQGASMAARIKAQSRSLPGVIFDPSKGTYTDTEGNPVSKIAQGQTVRSLFVSPELEADKARARKEVELELEPTIAAEVQRAKEEVGLDYPTMDDKGKSAVSAYKFIQPRIDKFKQIIDSGLFKDKALLKQISIDKDLQFVVPNGSPLEEAIGLINAVKLTGFNIAGTAFTGSEKDVAFTLLNPIGKSDKQIKTDIDSFLELFEERIETATEGLRGAKKLTAEIKAKRTGASDSNKQIPIPPKSQAPKGAKGWDTVKGEWVF